MRLSLVFVALVLALPLPVRADVSGDPHAPDSVTPSDADAPSPEATRLAVRASAGGATRALFDVFLGGAEADVGIGFDSRFGSFGITAAFFGGVVDGGFTAIHGTFGFDLAWPVGDVRLGFRPRVGYFDLERFTTERQFGAYTLGAVGHVSIDVHRKDGVAVALGIEPSAEVVAAIGNDGSSQDGAAPLLGGRGFVEVRWRRVD